MYPVDPALTGIPFANRYSEQFEVEAYFKANIASLKAYWMGLRQPWAIVPGTGKNPAKPHTLVVWH
jgi:hypothetical protein